MKKRILALIPALTLGLLLQAGAPYLVVVSFDGFRHDYRSLAPMPAFHAMIQSGFRSEALIPPFPSQTFPSHYSLVTGLEPVRHGLVLNRFFDPLKDEMFRMGDHEAMTDTNWFAGTPIWTQLGDEGVRSAVYHWVGSEAHHPDEWKTYLPGTPDSARLNQFSRWLGKPSHERPRAVFLYFEFLDDMGHWFGPGSPEVRRALSRTDSVLTVIRQTIASHGLTDSLNLLVVSDHGMTPLNLKDPIDLDPVVAYYDTTATIVPAYATVSVYSNGGAIAPPPMIAGIDWMRPPPGPFSHRFGDWIGIPEKGKVFSLNGKPLTLAPGGHGYDSRDPDMWGICYGSGPDFKPGSVIGSVMGVDVYALCRFLTGLPSDPEADGSLQPFIPALKSVAGSSSDRR